MKIIKLFTILFFLFSSTLFAQTYSKFFIGSNLELNGTSFNSISNKSIRNSSGGVGIIGGIQLKKILIGIGGNIDIINNSFDTTKGYSYQSIYLSPFIRYYFKNIQNTLFIHAQINLGTSKIQEKEDTTNWQNAKTQKYTLFGATLGIGYSIKIGKHLLIQPMFKINYFQNNSTNKSYKNFKSINDMIDFELIYNFFKSQKK